MENALNHNCPARIARDYARDEALGAEILASLDAPVAPVAPVVRMWTRQARKVNLVTGQVTIETLSEAA